LEQALGDKAGLKTQAGMHLSLKPSRGIRPGRDEGTGCRYHDLTVSYCMAVSCSSPRSDMRMSLARGQLHLNMRAIFRRRLHILIIRTTVTVTSVLIEQNRSSALMFHDYEAHETPNREPAT